MNLTKNRFRFTIEDRILLHLLDFVKWRNEVEVPSALALPTVEGVAVTMACLWSDLENV